DLRDGARGRQGARRRPAAQPREVRDGRVGADVRAQRMILGIGVDVVDIARFGRSLERTPPLRDRLFARSERDLPLSALAARSPDRGTPSRSEAAPLRRARIDAGAIADNVRVLRAAAGTPEFLAVVKADGYGHGAATAARAALEGGATWLGVADPEEALALR